MRGTWLAGPLVAAGLLAAPAFACAAAPVAAEPAPGSRVERPPAAVRLVLPTRVEEEFLVVRVTDEAGRVVSGRPPRPARPAGRRRAARRPVAGRAAGDLAGALRGRPRRGGPVRVGVGPPGPSDGADVVRSDHGPLPLLARLLALVGPLGLIGLLGLAAGVVAPAVAAGGIVVPGEKRAAAEGFRARAADALAPSAGAWWTAWWALVAVAAAGVVLAPLAALWVLREGPGELGALIGETRFGTSWLLQVAGLRWPPRAPSLGAAPAARLPDGAGGGLRCSGRGRCCALAAISWAGHASAGGDATANIVIDLLHSGATAAWIGGLLGLAVLVSPASPGSARATGCGWRPRWWSASRRSP